MRLRGGSFAEFPFWEFCIKDGPLGDAGLPTEAMEVADSERNSFEDVESQQHQQPMADEESFQSVDELQNHGVGAADIQKLKIAGICTIKVSVHRIHLDASTSKYIGREYDIEEVFIKGQGVV